MRVRVWAAAVAASCLAASPAGAWHNQGHMMVAEVAWRGLTAGARCRAVALLRQDPEYARGLEPSAQGSDEALFVNAATWPDRIKAQTSGFRSDGDDAEAPSVAPHAGDNLGLQDRWMHKYWHFADYPVPDDPAHPPPRVNLLERIALFRDALAAPATPAALKAYDLAWLLHLVGDAHQPLHLSDQLGPGFSHGSDAGGNGVAVSYTGYRELHGFWDGAPGDASGATTLAKAIAAAGALPAADPARAIISDPQAWGRETHALAVQWAYVAPVTLQSAGPFTLTPAYAAKATEVSRSQVGLAGVRLANLLNLALVWPDAACDARLHTPAAAAGPPAERRTHPRSVRRRA